MTPENLAALQAHAAQCYPREACGLLVNARGHERYVPCRNVADIDGHFAIDPMDWAQAEDRSQILAIVHTHPNASAAASQADLVSCEMHGLPWLILSWPMGTLTEIAPSGYKAPLIGRQFAYGVLDCFELVRDWFHVERGIEIPPRPADGRCSDWWKRGADGEPPANLYMQHFQAYGFARIEPYEAQPGDVALIQIGADVANHLGVLLPGGLILHHVWGRLSCREVYGGYWRKHTRAIVRHGG